MLNDLFFNSVILVATISLGTQAFKEKPLAICNTQKIKLLSGVLTGLLGCLLMLYSVHINSRVILDLRNISIIISSVYFGFLPTIITGCVIGLFRILYFGLSSSSIIGLSMALVISTGCGFISKASISHKKKWIYCTVCSLIMGSVGLIISIGITVTLINILFYYWISMILMSILLYFYVGYLYQSGELYRRYRDELKRDFLTGLNNVREFDNTFNEIISKLKNERNRSLSLLSIDIDFFKKVNDTYGHAVGDLVLKEFSNILTDTCRSVDLIFRNGGEEFSVILLDYSAPDAVAVAERIRAAAQSHKFKLMNGKEVSITISIGISSYPDTTTNIDALLEEADKALYIGKRSGRNRVVLSDVNVATSNLQ